MHIPTLTPRCRAFTLAVALPFFQGWSDTGLISRDDDWSGVAGLVGFRGDGLTAAAGTDPRRVVADGSGTPVDVNANERWPLPIGAPAGVAEFELADPVVALRGSASAAVPHLVLSLDTRGRARVVVRFRLRDVDPFGDAVQPAALQYRVGRTGNFAAVPGGFVSDATTGPGKPGLITPVAAVLPAAADDRPLVQLRVITTNANGQDEWVGVDDIEVTARAKLCTPVPPGAHPPRPRPPWPLPGLLRPPPPGPPAPAPPAQAPRRPAPELTELRLSPAVFAAARKGPAVRRSGRAGTALRFRLSYPATVRFRVLSPSAEPERGRFRVRGRRGLNRLRFSGRLRGRALPAGAYRLVGTPTGADGEPGPSASAWFRIR